MILYDNFAANPLDRTSLSDGAPTFDPDHPTEDLSFFEPMVREAFGRKACDPAVPKPGAAEGLPAVGYRDSLGCRCASSPYRNVRTSAPARMDRFGYSFARCPCDNAASADI